MRIGIDKWETNCHAKKRSTSSLQCNACHKHEKQSRNIYVPTCFLYMFSWQTAADNRRRHNAPRGMLPKHYSMPRRMVRRMAPPRLCTCCSATKILPIGHLASLESYSLSTSYPTEYALENIALLGQSILII